MINYWKTLEEDFIPEKDRRNLIFCLENEKDKDELYLNRMDLLYEYHGELLKEFYGLSQYYDYHYDEQMNYLWKKAEDIERYFDDEGLSIDNYKEMYTEKIKNRAEYISKKENIEKMANNYKGDLELLEEQLEPEIRVSPESSKEIVMDCLYPDDDRNKTK